MTEKPNQVTRAPLAVVAVEAPAQGSLVVSSLDEAFEAADFLMAAGLRTKDDTDRVKVAGKILMGLRLGLDPIAAVQGIANVNGQTKVWGNTMLGIVQSHPEYEGLTDKKFIGDKDVRATPSPIPSDFGVEVIAKRRGRPDVVSSFTWAEAVDAGYAAKDTYKKRPAQMLYRRAVALACERQWSDVLLGMNVVFGGEEHVELAPTEYTVKTAGSGSGGFEQPEPVTVDLDLPAFDTPGQS